MTSRCPPGSGFTCPTNSGLVCLSLQRRPDGTLYRGRGHSQHGVSDPALSSEGVRRGSTGSSSVCSAVGTGDGSPGRGEGCSPFPRSFRPGGDGPRLRYGPGCHPDPATHPAEATALPCSQVPLSAQAPAPGRAPTATAGIPSPSHEEEQPAPATTTTTAPVLSAPAASAPHLPPTPEARRPVPAPTPTTAATAEVQGLLMDPRWGVSWAGTTRGLRTGGPPGSSARGSPGLGRLCPHYAALPCHPGCPLQCGPT